MNSIDVSRVLDQIEATGSRIDKAEILKKHIGDPLMAKVLKYAYDPFITFGIKPPSRFVGNTGSGIFDEDSLIWAMLDGLADRQVTGGAAATMIEEALKALDLDSASLLFKIMTKDLRCGITAKTINLVQPGLVPVFDVMLAHKFEDKRIKSWPVAVEPKLDGVRVICLVRDGRARFFSRRGLPFPAVEHLEGAVLDMVKRSMDVLAELDALPRAEEYFRLLGGNSSSPTIALDGEITAGDFNKTVGDVRRKSESAADATYTVFDALSLVEFSDPAETITMDCRARRHFTKFVLSNGVAGSPIKLIGRSEVSSIEEIMAIYDKVRAEGGEGVIVKPFHVGYEKKRSYGWLKIKGEETEDLEVIGAFEGEGKLVGNLGALMVKRPHNGEIVLVSVGGGFADAERRAIWDLWVQDARDAGTNFWEMGKDFWKTGKGKPDGVELIGKLEAYANPDRRLLGRLIEVEFHEVTPDGSLRHPRFVRFRDDKALDVAA